MPRITEDEANSSKNEVNDIKEPIIAAYFTNWSVYNEKEPTAFPGSTFEITDKNKTLTDNTISMNEKLENVNAIVYAFLEIKQDKNEINPLSGRLDSSYTTEKSDLGKVVFFDPWSDFAKEKDIIWQGQHHYKWQRDNIDLLPQKMGTKDNPLTLNPIDDGFNYNFFHYGNFNAFADETQLSSIGIGGYGDHYTHGWKAAVAHPDRFSESIIRIAKEFNINGVDLDWEPLSEIKNSDDIIKLSKAVKEAADKNHVDLTITFPITVDKKQIEDFETNYGKTNGKWAELSKYVDHIGIMGYDMHGAFDNPKLTGLHSMLYPVKNDKGGHSVDGAIQKLNEFGVDNDHITLGIPGYARGVEGVINHGLGQKFTAADSNANLDPSAGITSYKHLIDNVIKGKDIIMDVTVKVNDKDIVTGAYANIGNKFYSFESPDSLQAKVDYVKDNGLAGMFIWTIENDKVGDDSLLSIMHNGLIGNDLIG